MSMIRAATAYVLLMLLLGTVVHGAEPGKELVALGRRCEKRVAELRGLKVIEPIRWELADKDKVRDYLLKTLDEQYAPGEMENEGKALEALGFLPAGTEYKQFMLDLFEEQIGGVYDPKENIFYLAKWIAPHMQETIIAHELTHALQDQHFNLDEFTERIEGNSDAVLARASVIEGEATLVMMMYSLEAMGMEAEMEEIELDGNMMSLMMSLSSTQFPSLAEAPEVIRQTLMFPYVEGMNFVVFGKGLGGFGRIDKIYEDLPRSTEQILHPQKYYLDRDPPAVVSLPGASGLAGEGWDMIYEETLGEFMTRHLLGELDDQEEQNIAAAGWDGDHVWVFEKDGQLAWVQLSVWDSQKDAVEFAGAFAKAVPAKAPGFVAQPVGQQPRMSWKDEGKGMILVERRGRQVLIVFQLSSAAARRIVKAAWQG